MKKSIIFIISLFNAALCFSQSIVNLNPNCINAGQTLNVTITGRNTKFTQGSSSLQYFGNYFEQGSSTIRINSTIALTDTTLMANVTALPNVPPQIFNVYMLDPRSFRVFGKIAAIYVNAPSNPYIESVTPNNISSGQTLNVTITGKNTRFTQVNPSMLTAFGNYFEQGSSTIQINSATPLTDSTLSANITAFPNLPPQIYNVSMFDLQTGYTYGKTAAISVNSHSNPSIESINPDDISAGQTLNVTITGKNTRFTQASPSVLNLFGNYFEQGSSTIHINSMTPLTDSTLNANITAFSDVPPQVFHVEMYDEQTNYYYGKLFTFTVGPLVQNITPTIVAPNQTVNITINCVNANLIHDTARVWLTNNSEGCTTEILASNVLVTSANSAVATFPIPPTALLGLWDVNVIDDSKGYFYGYQMLRIDTLTGISTIPFNGMENASLFPNPNNGTFTIATVNPTKFDKIEIFDISGKLVYSDIMDMSSNITSKTYCVSQLPNGIYFVRVWDGMASKVLKLAIIK